MLEIATAIELLHQRHVVGQRRGQVLARPEPRHALLGMIGFLRAVTQGLIGVSSALLSMSVGVVIVLGYFIAKEKINRWQLIGLAIGAFSIVVLAGAHG